MSQPSARTVTVEVDASPDQVFAYVADLANFPDWATGFAREFELDGDMARVMTPDGPVQLRIRDHARTGVIDFLVCPPGQKTTVFPSRVTELPDGRSAYAFTIFPEPGQSAEAFAAAVASLEEELDNVARLAAEVGR